VPREQDEAPAPTAEILTQPVCGFRLWAARAIDLAVVVLVGCIVALIGGLTDPGAWEWRGVWIADYIAEWIYAHPGSTLYGVLAALLFGFLYSAACGVVGGRTLGRYVVDT